MPALRELELAFLEALVNGPSEPACGCTDGHEVRSGGTKRALSPLLAAFVAPSGRLGAAERVDIYAGMYHARLRAALAEDFPRVAAILGDDGFASLCRAYLAAYPSRHPSLRHLGHRLPTFLARCAEPGAGLFDPGALPYLADLARLEWARLEVFDAPDAAALGREQLVELDPDAWAALVLRLVPAVAVVETSWPLHEIWQAAGETATGSPSFEPRSTVLRVWRDGFTVFHAAMDETERLALRAVIAREPFGVLCESLSSLVPPESAPGEAAGLVLRWIEDGLLAATTIAAP